MTDDDVADVLNRDFPTFETAAQTLAGNPNPTADGAIGPGDIFAATVSPYVSEEDCKVAYRLWSDGNLFSQLCTAGNGKFDFQISDNDVNVFIKIRQMVSDILAATPDVNKGAVGSGINSLLNDAKFQALDGDTKTSILRQIENDPSESVVDSLTEKVDADCYTPGVLSSLNTHSFPGDWRKGEG